LTGYRDIYRQKQISADEAAGLVKSGAWIDYGAICGFPSLIDQRLSLRAPELTEVKIRAEHSPTRLPRVDPQQQHFIHNSWFFSQLERQYHDGGSCSYIPFNLSEGPRMYREWLKDEVDIIFIEVTPMDEHGFFNFGAAVTRQLAACQAARIVVVEVNQSQPWVYGGHDEVIHISQVDYIVENYEYRIPEFPVEPATATDEKIAQSLVGLIEDGATIQLGVGGIPNAVGRLLIKHGLKDLGIHTEMFTESMVDLIEAGVVTGSRKSINPGRAVHCFGAGSRRLYQFMDRNPALAGFPADYTNDPYVIARNHQQIAINGALRVDLKGQVCSETAGFRHISGTGGQLDFTRGAYLSPRGKAFICLYATRPDRDGKLTSNIVPTLQPGDMVTVPASDVSYVVTEFGVVNLKGKSLWQRAHDLISIAHPDFRHRLETTAYKMKLITRGTRA